MHKLHLSAWATVSISAGLSNNQCRLVNKPTLIPPTPITITEKRKREGDHAPGGRRQGVKQLRDQPGVAVSR